MYELTKNIEFRNLSSKFQSKLNSDIRNIQNDPKVYCSADKTTNFYKMEPKTADILIKTEINKEYVKAKTTAIKKSIKKANILQRN